MGLVFLVDQIYLVSSGNYDPHSKNLRFSVFFIIYRALLDCTSKLQALWVYTKLFFNKEGSKVRGKKKILHKLESVVRACYTMVKIFKSPPLLVQAV